MGHWLKRQQVLKANLVMLLLVLPAVGIAQKLTTKPEPPSLSKIVVTAPRLKRNWLTVPASVSVIGKQAVQQGEQKLQLNDALSRVPGVFARNRTNFAQDLRVSIRGFGARSPWGIRGIQIIVDGIPATLPDGQSQVDVIDLGTIQRVEVLRGPFSALYGNATGGVINITTQTPDRDGNYTGGISGGSDGYSRLSATAGKQYDKWGYIVTATNLELNGYRVHSSVHKQFLTAKANVDIGAAGKLRFITRMLDAPDTQDPGGVSLQRAELHPESARPANIHYNSRQSADQETGGLIYTDSVSTQQAYKARLFYTHRNFIQYLPFKHGGAVTYDRDYYGGGVQTARHDDVSGVGVKWVLGVDFGVQNDDRQRYNNIAGEKGALVFDEMQQAANVGAFLQSVWSFNNQIDLTAGLRYDWLKFKIDDHYVTAGNPDDSGSRLYTELSGNLGLSYEWRSQQYVYADIATAFESPTFSEFGNPNPDQGGFNPYIKPQTAINYEVGAKGVVGDRMRYQISAFWINTKDELVAFESHLGRKFFKNAGKTRRRGIEASIKYFLTDHLKATASYTDAEYKFIEFTRKGHDLSGNWLPGLPQQTLFAGLKWRYKSIGFASIDALWVSERYADSANNVTVPDYNIINMHFGKFFHPGGHVLTVYAGINNVFDEGYFSNTRINAYGGRYYESAPRRTFYAGIKLKI